MKLGVETDSQDLTGNIVCNKSFDHVTLEMLRDTIKQKYLGNIQQTPPLY